MFKNWLNYSQVKVTFYPLRVHYLRVNAFFAFLQLHVMRTGRINLPLNIVKKKQSTSIE